MNVLITIPSLADKGGVAGYYNAILPLLEKEEGLNISYLEVGSTKDYLKIFHPLSDMIRFYSKLSNYTPDLVHVNPSLNLKSYIRDGVIIFLSKLKRVPVLVFFRGWAKSFEPIVENKLRWFFKKTYMKTDGFIVLASEFRERLLEWGIKVPVFMGTTVVDEKLTLDYSIEKKIKIIKNAPEKKILFISRIEKEKGIFETLDALNLLVKKGHDVSLTIAGEGPALNNAIKYVSKDKTLLDKVTFLGDVRGEKKKAIFESHHLCCFPSSYGEGMPTSVLEAMVFGMPIITRPVGGIKDFFENGKMGYITDSKDPDVIAELLEKIIIDKDKISEMARYNHFFAKKHFMAPKEAKRLINIYKIIVSRCN